MINIKQKWNDIPKRYKMGALLLAQIWIWPQVFYAEMPANIGLPLSVTVLGLMFWNIIEWITAVNDEE